MPEIIVRLWQRIIEFWNGMDKSQKIRLGITAGILGIAIFVGVYFVSKPNYYTIESKDIGILMNEKAALDSAGISNHVNDAQNAIFVNMSDRDAALVALANGGFLQAGETFDEALKSISITSTQDDKAHIWKNWDENQIAQLLKKGNAVKEAIVRLQVPEKSNLFASEEESSAAIKIQPIGATPLTPKQVQGIIDLVTHSVKGLKPEKVKITDWDNNTLRGTETDDELGLATTQHQMKKLIKEEWEKDIRALLPSYTDTYDSFEIVAEPKLDFDKQSINSTTYGYVEGKDDPSVLSSKSSSTTATGDTQGQAPGTNTNPNNGTTTYPNGSTSGGSYKTSSNEVANIYDKKESTTEKALGSSLPELSTVSITLRYGNLVKDAAKITPQVIQDIQETVSKATGGVPVSQISVKSFKLPTIVATQPSITETITQFVNDFGMPVILTLLALALMIMAMPRKKKELAVAEELIVNSDGTLTGHTGPRFVVPEAEDPVPEIDLEEKSEIKKQIERFVQQKPDAVAQLLRNWLQEEDWE